ncbi:MAG: hypothetical protein E4H14_09410 [Candidatus Thorarchaeota archaeon]|nr:MAG: hypothetical protein E4H14_09410 [Candidatus Thorarchaeota archaeon]
MSLTEPFRVKAYLHSDKESMEDCVVSAIDNYSYKNLTSEVQKKLRYMLYEVAFELNVDPLTGKYIIVSVTDGDQVLTKQK